MLARFALIDETLLSQIVLASNLTFGELSATHSGKISEKAKIYRKIIRDALEVVGFVNYPTKYWHWSLGDRYWAYHKQADHAFYGTVDSLY